MSIKNRRKFLGGHSVWACGSKDVFLPGGLCGGLGRAEGVGVRVGEVNCEAFSGGGGGIPGSHGGMERGLRYGGEQLCYAWPRFFFF